MVARCHDDALHARPPRRFEHVVDADDVRLEDHVPGVFAGISAEMDNAIHTLDHSLDRSHVGNLSAVDLLAVARRRQGHPIGQP